MPVDPVGERLAEWLKSVLLDEAGDRRLTDDQLRKDYGIHKGTIHQILRGEGGRTTNRTLKRIADIFGVEPPRIERRLTWEGPPVSEAPRAILRAARGLLERLDQRLEQLEATSAGADSEASARRAVVLAQEEREAGRTDPQAPDEAPQSGAAG